MHSTYLKSNKLNSVLVEDGYCFFLFYTLSLYAHFSYAYYGDDESDTIMYAWNEKWKTRYETRSKHVDLRGK